MMQKDCNIDISIIIPVYTGHENLKYLLPAINQQTLLPDEIVIVDSTSNTEVQELIDNMHLDVPIHYHREDKRAFPGKARNIGVSIAQHEYIAFLDCRTIPSDNWLHHYTQAIKENAAGMIIGSTTVLANNKFQWYLRSATYGKRPYDTIPGTLMKKQLFVSIGRFTEELRMGEDQEWMQRLHNDQIEYASVTSPFLEYSGLPKSLLSACLKYLESGYYKSFVMESFKNLFFSASLVAAILVIPRWNFMFEGWDTSPLYIPNVTKIFFLILMSVLLIWRLVYFLTPRKLPDNLFVSTVKLTVLIIVTWSVYLWNASMALWVEDAILYIPHITKIYLGLLLGSVFIYRGLIKPIMNNTPREKLLPTKWLLVGILGLTMDIAKIPGTIYGAIHGRLKQLIRQPNTIEK